MCLTSILLGRVTGGCVDIVFVDVQNDSTPLHYAAWYGHTDAISALLDAGADINATNQVRIPQIHSTRASFAAASAAASSAAASASACSAAASSASPSAAAAASSQRAQGRWQCHAPIDSGLIFRGPNARE